MPKSRAVSETEQEEETNNESSSAAKSHIQFLDLTNGKGGDQSMGEDDDEDDDDNDVDVNDDLVGQAVYGDESMVFGTNNNNLHHLNHNDLHSNPNSSYEEGGEEGNNNNNNHNEEDEYDDVGILHTLADLSSVPSSSQKNEVVYSSESAMMTMLMGTAAAAAAASSGSNNSIGGGSLGSLEDPASDSIEHTGRWTKEEHEAFLAGLQKFGKEWKKVAAKVKTRTVVQTRTHAQKYFQKLQKTIDVKGDGGDWSVDIGTDSNLTSSSVAVAAAVEPKKVSASNTVGRVRRTKGHVVVAPASTDALNNSSSSHKAFRRGSAATLSAAQVISTLSAAKTTNATDFGVHPNSNITPSRNAIATTASPHGFSFSDDGGGKSQMVAASENENSSGFVGWRLGKIVAPDPSDPRSKFPEPSPAATGKRKLAEMAAARMLAGVGSPDGPPTPPAPDPPSASLRLSNAPPPPLFSRNKGATLQIVNPESLGVTYQTKGKRGDSPMTPWDGELEALVVSAALDEDEDKGVSLSIETDLVSANYDTGDNKLLCTASTPSNVHPIHGPPDAFERSPLHQAVCSQDVEALRTLLQVVEPEDLQRIDEAGFSPLHSACAVLLHPERDNNVDENGCNEMVRLLLSAGAKPTQLDSKGNCPLHWAARAGDSDATDQLLSCNGNLFENVQNSSGETPLHWGLRAGNKGADIVALLLTHGARPGILDKNFRRAIDVAAEGFLDDDMSIAAVALRGAGKSKKPPGEMKKLLTQSNQERRDCRANILIRSTPSRTLVLHHPECLEHHTKSQADWEAPDRVRTIMKRILPSSDPTGATETSGIFPYEVTVSQEFDRASLDLLSRVHSTEYLSFVNTLSKDLERKVHETGGASSQDSDPLSWSPPPVVPFTPMVQRTMIRIHESNVKLSDNSDTSFSVGSLRAARRAAGAVQHAVHSVLLGKNRNAFCVVRPPGHHAGINGLLEGGESCGFCIFNNVAAGALYAISDDKLVCDRCAIVDIDVHHGNGTEEIVRKCHDPSKMFFFSIHLYDNDKDEKKKNANQFIYKFYPGTGCNDDLAMNIINVPITPLWKDTSSPSSTRTHNTRKKTRSAQEATDDDSEPSTQQMHAKGSDAASDTGSSSNAAHSPKPHVFTAPPGRLAYRQAIQNRLLPALRAFNPDLILISAGFDAAKGDVGNARHEKDRERMGLDLEPEDYAWTTRKILEIADICCQGRVVSVLEGGYGRTPAAPSAGGGLNCAVPSDLDRGALGECAIRHLHAMVDPYDAENRFGQS